MKKYTQMGLTLLALLVATAAYAVVTTSQKTVTTAATALCSTTVYQTESCLVINQGSVSVYLGGSSAVTSSTGVELKAAAGTSITLKQSESLYGVTATSTARVDVLESK